MRLYLVQHGGAKTEAEDPKEGRRTVERMAEFLASAGVSVDRSEKLRAGQTAEIQAARLRPPGTHLRPGETSGS